MYAAPVASPGLGFAVHSFLASPHARNTCGNNGLPLTPNSIRILGRFRRLKTFTHPSLTSYLDLQRGKHERIAVVYEFYDANCLILLSDKSPNQESQLAERYVDRVRRIFVESLNGIHYLHQRGIVHHSLSLENVQLTEDMRVKLANYGTYYITEEGACVPFPIGLPKYLPAEVLLNSKGCHSPKTDIWSLGIVLLELSLRKVLFNFPLEEQVRLILRCAHHEKPVMVILEEHKATYEYLHLREEVRDLIEACLTPKMTERPSAEELLAHPYCDIPMNIVHGCPPHELVCSDSHQIDVRLQNSSQLPQAWNVLNVHELYYFWKLAGGDGLAEMTKQRDHIRSKPPIFGMPKLAMLEGEDYGVYRDSSYYYRDTVLKLPMDSLRNRLKSVHPSIMFKSMSIICQGRSRAESFFTQKTAGILPLVIRERDIEYQIRRVFAFRHLIEAYPFGMNAIETEAETDIPPYFRGHVWAALLGAQGDYHSEFDEVDKETSTSMDRQIDVDIPRCHQYDQLLSSPTAHDKFRRLLKAWVSSHPQYVYWQGLDSLCAPFLSLHFNNEALAYQCLSRFVDRYLHKFFLQDNSQVIKEYLAVFSRLVTYHDPVLSLHLQRESFIPDLYAIPWFLTMYTHVFPLHKIYHLWDALLLRDESFPLCIGVAILLQLRDQLVTFGFNECILTFSDMPEVCIERLVKDAVDVWDNTPPSICYRSHSRKPCPGMEPLSLEVLRVELCPRLSIAELQMLMGLNKKAGRLPKERVLVIDVRPKEEFLGGCLPGAVSVPASTGFTADGKLSSCPESSALASHRGNLVAVFGTEDDRREVSNKLVALEFRHVCIIQATLQDLRSINVLNAPMNVY